MISLRVFPPEFSDVAMAVDGCSTDEFDVIFVP